MDARTGVRGRQGLPDDAPAPTTDAVAPVDEAPRPTSVPELGDEPTRFAELALGAVALFAVPIPGRPVASSSVRSPSRR